MSDGVKEEGISGSLKVLENEGDEGIEAWLCGGPLVEREILYN